jgi:DNA-binding beta-propeller fold protein YncE
VALPLATVNAAALRLAVAWNSPDNRTGAVQAMDANPPWSLTTSAIEVGRDALLRYAGGRLYVVQPEANVISAIDPDSWAIIRTYTLPAGTEPEDIAVVANGTAYVSGRRATHLIRLNLNSGATENAADLGIFADADGVPDLGGMAVHAGRLLVQVRRMNVDVTHRFVPPAYLAVVDVATGQLVDIDASVPGVQAIQLAGTSPKRAMQLIPEARRLLISATGGYFDEGGIEMIDLDALRSLGLVVHEVHGLTGADTGPFVMVTPQRGYLVYTTDLTISSHLNEFTLATGPAPLPVFTKAGFLAPALVFEPVGNRMFFANSATTEPGVRVFDADGQQLTTEPIATGGQPTDLALLSDSPFSAEPASLVIGLHAGLRITGTTGATYRIEYVNQAEATNWTALTNITLPGSPFFWADPDAATNQTRRYYRAVSVD